MYLSESTVPHLSERQANISVIVTVYKRIDYIREAIASVLAQTIRPLEIIVADDSNRPEIRSLVADFGESIIRYRGNPEHLGVAQNLKAAILSCQGEFISILNDDDIWTSAVLEKLSSPLLADSNVLLAFSDHWLMDSNGAIDKAATDQCSLHYQRTGLPSGIVTNALEFAVLNNGVPLAMASMFRKCAFDPEVLVRNIEGAYDFWMTCNLVRSGKIYYVAERLTKYRIHSQSETARQSAEKADCMLYIYERLLNENYFPELSAQLKLRYLDSLIRCGQNRLFHGQKRASRSYFIQSIKLHPTLKASALLSASLLPVDLVLSIVNRARANGRGAPGASRSKV